MKILALDTSSPACTVALAVGEAVEERFETTPRGHGQRVLAMVESLLAEAGLAVGQLDGIVFGRGPGAFTGVRIATSVVQGLAWSADLPVVPVSSLAALAQGALRERGEEAVAAAFDARMGELYWGLYRCQDGVMVEAEPECVAPADRVPVPKKGRWFGTGSGWGAAGEVLAGRFGETLGGVECERLPRARDLVTLGRGPLQRGETVVAAEAQPVYLRNEVAKPKATEGEKR